MANTTVKAPRITKAMRYEDIKALLEGKEVPQIQLESGTMIDRTSLIEALAFIDRELGLLARKNKVGGEKKLTAKQEANEVLKGKILEFLEVQEAPVSCADVWKGVVELNDYPNQKVVALLNSLVKAGKVEAEEVKRKLMYSVVTE